LEAEYIHVRGPVVKEDDSLSVHAESEIVKNPKCDVQNEYSKVANVIQNFEIVVRSVFDKVPPQCEQEVDPLDGVCRDTQKSDEVAKISSSHQTFVICLDGRYCNK
jgi:hypothetical protein